MFLFPITTLSGIDCFNLVDYVEENRRFIEKMGNDIIAFNDSPFWGLDGNPYLSAKQMQVADEVFVFNNKLTR